jgi:hypothetical protein
MIAGKSDQRVVTQDASTAPRAAATPASFVGGD